MDPVDLRLIAELQRDARLTNRELARRVGVPESTCHERTRQLFDRGLLTGARAVVDPAAVGRPVQAMISVRVRPQRRDAMEALLDDIVALPGVLSTSIVTGVNDIVVHVAVPDMPALRDFVWDHLTRRPEVSDAHTALVYEHRLGPPLLPQER